MPKINRRLLGLVMIVAGAIIGWLGWEEKQSIGSGLKSAITGSPSDKAVYMLGAAGFLIVGGIFWPRAPKGNNPPVGPGGGARLEYGPSGRRSPTSVRLFGGKPGDLVLVTKNVPHSIRNTHATANMACILARSPLPCQNVAVKTEA